MSMQITFKENAFFVPILLVWCDVMLEGMNCQKYLGVDITSTLNWSLQCNEVKKKANRVLGILQRNLPTCDRAIKEKAYISLV